MKTKETDRNGCKELKRGGLRGYGGLEYIQGASCDLQLIGGLFFYQVSFGCRGVYFRFAYLSVSWLWEAHISFFSSELPI